VTFTWRSKKAMRPAALATFVMSALLLVSHTDAQQAPGARGGGARGAPGAAAPAAGQRGGGAAAQNPNSISPIEFLIEPPTLIVAFAGDTSTRLTVGAWTTIVAVPVRPSLDAVIVAVPGESAATMPVDVTVATSA